MRGRGELGSEKYPHLFGTNLGDLQGFNMSLHGFK